MRWRLDQPTALNTFNNWLHIFNIGLLSVFAWAYASRMSVMTVCCSAETPGGSGIAMATDCLTPITRELCLRKPKQTRAEAQEPKHE